MPDVGRFGVAICYDMWFPELLRQMTSMGAEVILNPVMANFIDRPADLAIVQASGAMFQSYIVSVNGLGVGGNGQSMIVDPAGRVLHQAGSHEAFLPLELDLDQVRRQRERGLLGLGQPLKSFRDCAIDFPVYDRAGGDRSYLDTLGPLEKPGREGAARRRGVPPAPRRRIGPAGAPAMRLALDQRQPSPAARPRASHWPRPSRDRRRRGRRRPPDPARDGADRLQHRRRGRRRRRRAGRRRRSTARSPTPPAAMASPSSPATPAAPRTAARTTPSASSIATARPVATYAKTHLFGGVDRAQFAAGDGYAPVVMLDGWRLGLAICYDIEFPETARLLALAGAEAILAPTANMAPFDSVALRLVPSRAEENAVYVAYANYCGSEGEFDYVGLSCVCGPDGADVARAGRGPEMIFADLDRDTLAAARARSTQLADRRPDLYAPLAKPEGPR